MAITAQDVKELREKTGVGMMECKKALMEAAGDMSKAIDILREKGAAMVAKKASRVAADGAVVTYYDDGLKKGVIVEVNSETDFVAKNQKFVDFCNDVAKSIIAKNPADVEALMSETLVDAGISVTDKLTELIQEIKENMKVRRFEIIDGIMVSYIHAGGAVGVVVKFDTSDEIAAKPEFEAMGKNIAMQVAAMSPEYLSKDSIPEDELAKIKSITVDSALHKPESLPVPILNDLINEAISDKKWSDEDIEIYQGLDNKQRKNFVNFISKEALQTLADIAVSHKADIVENKIFTGLVNGRFAKQIKEICLLEQEFVRSDLYKGDVLGYINSVAKELGGDITVTGFIRYAKGEGIEKKEENFADEIASMVKGE
ncbi:MAG: elongation factor Ts [Clostridia bacterium]|nr:elongation factor Ts [Clostridia bacterium]